MSLSGGDMGDMGERLSDAEVEALIGGSTNADPSLGELLAEVKEYAVWKPAPGQQANHIVEAVAAVRVGAGWAASDAGQLSSPGMTRRQGMIGRIMATRVAKVLAAAMAVLLATSGIAWAATGSNPVDQVTSVVGQVGQVFSNDHEEDDQVKEADDTADDIDEDQAVVVDDTNDDQVKDSDVDDTDDDQAAVVDDTNDDQLEESDHEEDDQVKETDVDDDQVKDSDVNDTDELDEEESDHVDEQESDHVDQQESDHEDSHDSETGDDD
jgi:hypothetical protein